VSNEETAPLEVYFDDMKITYTKSPVVQADDYYAFGLSVSDLSFRKASAMPNQYKYNGKEEQDELNIGWVDYGARMYDNAIGRWMAVDPLAEKARRWSPYTYAYDNPIRFIDPDGMKSTDVVDVKSETKTGGQATGGMADADGGAKGYGGETGRNTYLGADGKWHTDIYYDDYSDSGGGGSGSMAGVMFGGGGNGKNPDDESGVTQEEPYQKPGPLDLLSEKSFNFQKAGRNWQASRVKGIYFIVVDGESGVTYENFFTLEIGVPKKSKDGVAYSKEEATDKAAMVANSVATQTAFVSKFIGPGGRAMTLNATTLPYYFATQMQLKLNNYIPGSTVTANTYQYSVKESNAVYVNFFKGLLERLF
jgi:RHS repeat-associated protein